MTTAFNIISENAEATPSALLLEISKQGISYVALSEEKVCLALAMHHFPMLTNHDEVGNYLKKIVAAQPLLQQSFQRINIVYAFAESLLTPNAFTDNVNNKDLLDLVFGAATHSTIHHESMAAQAIQNVFRIAAPIEAAIAQLFPSAQCSHLYSHLAKAIPASGNWVRCIFSTTQITVCVTKDSQLQLMQQFDYAVPGDIAYHLLNICTQFDLPLNHTIVQLNGMIDVASNLYGELHKYFLNIELGVLPEQFIYPEALTEYPAHYFSHLFQTAACV